MGIVKNLENLRFGRLLVVKREGLNKHKQATWLCLCDCGNYLIKSTISLTSGNTKSCGCYRKEKVSLENEQATKNKVFYIYKRRAIKKNIEFFLTKDEFLKIVSKDCFYCGSKPSNKNKNEYGNGDFIYNSIDRIDSSKGYTKDNIVPCCKYCNTSKLDRNINEFYEWIEKVYKHKKGNMR